MTGMPESAEEISSSFPLFLSLNTLRLSVYSVILKSPLFMLQYEGQSAKACNLISWDLPILSKSKNPDKCITQGKEGGQTTGSSDI